MQREEFIEIKGKIVSGIFALTTRTFILQIISFIATFILTILLSPSVFGVFFVVTAVTSFLSYFSDVGLAAALIQKKSDPSQKELASVFTLQQVLVGTIVVVALFLSGTFGKFYKLDREGIFLLQALLLSFFLSSLKTIPSVLLERRLEFSLLVIPQIAETFSFYVLTIILAVCGFGIRSFAWGAVLRGIVGLVSIYIISPWRISFNLSIDPIRELLTFGIPFQVNSLLALIKDDLITIFLGKILPFDQVGYIGWAKKWAEVPLRLIMDSIIRVTFPAYCRFQDNKEILGKAIQKSFFFLGLFIFPATTVLVFCIKPLVYIIPKYLKWEPALTLFYLFSFSSVFASFSSPLVNALNAIGKIRKTLVLMVFWAVLTWILVPSFAFVFGYQGVALAALVISSTFFIPIIMMRKYVYFPVVPSIYKPALATFIMVIPLFTILQMAQSLGAVVISFLTGGLIYGSIVWFWMREEIKPYLPRIIHGKI